jgi:YesN/AraC family two-component response regulator
MNDEKDIALKVLGQARFNMDSNLRDLNSLSSELDYNKAVASLIENKMPSQDNLYTEYLYNFLRNNTGASKSIIDSYVYRISDNTVFSNNGQYKSDIFFKNIRNYKEMSSQELINLISNIKANTYLPLMQYESNKYTQGEVVTYLYPIYYNSSKPVGVFAAILDASYMKDVLLPVKYRLDSQMLIIDKKNNVFMSTSPDFDVVSLKNKIKTPERFFSYSINNKKYLCTSLDSIVNDWTYIILIPETTVLGRINYLKDIFMIIIIICIIIGLSISYFLSSRNYKPIKGIFDAIKSLNKENNADNDNSVLKYDTVIKILKDFFTEKTELENKMLVYTPIIRKNYIIKLVTGKINKIQEVKEIEDILKVDINASKYGIIVFNVDDYLQLSDNNNEEKQTMARFIISNISEEVALNTNRAFVIEEAEKIHLLVIYSNEKDVNQCLEEAEKIVRDTFSIAEEKYKIMLSAGIGNIYSDYLKIRDSYLEANAALSHKFINGRSSIILFKNITVDNLEYYYPFEVENQIIQYVKVGDSDSANELLVRIFKENFTQRKLPLKIARCVAFDIICTIFKILQQTNISYEHFLNDNLDISESLVNTQNVNELFNVVSSVVKTVCGHINSLKEQSNQDLREKVIDYLNNNYQDSNLSLTSVAEAFNLSNYYLSRIFKDLVGENYVDYLSKLRIKRAKELLTKGVLVNDVAEKVGYNSANTFIRVFKRYEIQTPMQFREANVSIN